MFACNVPEIDKGIKARLGNIRSQRDLPRLGAINASNRRLVLADETKNISVAYSTFAR